MMSISKMSADETAWLVDAMIHISSIDGAVSPVEVMLIDRVMQGALWDEEARRRIKKRMGDPKDRPPFAEPPASLSYDNKVRVFQEIVDLVFADGTLDKVEQDVVMKLANALGLHLSDMQTIWSRAKRRHESG